MNKFFRTAILLIMSVMTSTILLAQEETSYPTPPWISDKGYWIIESNVKQPRTAIIHFYNIDNKEVYSEKVEGITLNLKKRKTLMRLKKALEQSVNAAEHPGIAEVNTDLVINLFNRKQRSW